MKLRAGDAVRLPNKNGKLTSKSWRSKIIRLSDDGRFALCEGPTDCRKSWWPVEKIMPDNER